jgi:hypothetical protein
MGRGRGQPSKFNEALAESIYALAASGDTDAEIANKVGISQRTLLNWKGKHPDFLRAMRESKTVADDLVEATLFQLAIGGHRMPKLKAVYDHDSKEFKVHTYLEILAPNYNACELWLRNRKPAEWRANPPELEDEPDDGDTIDADWKIEILGGAPATLDEMREASIRYYDKKPPPLKIAGKPDEPS